MAYFVKTATGWRVQIARKGVRLSRTFVTKKAGELWAAQEERKLIDGEGAKWPRKTVRQALDRYSEEVTPSKGSAKAEGLRLLAFTRDFPELAAKVMSDFTPADAAAWRDARLKLVSPGTVKRESNTLRAVWTIAVREWGWCGESPWPKIKLPPDNPARERLAGWREIRAVLRRCDYATHHPPVSGLQNAAWAFLIGLRTGMRAAEILRMQVGDVDGSVAIVRKHKTEHLTGKPRYVPLTPQGARLFAELVAYAKARGRDNLFSIKPASLDAQFRDVTASLMIDDLHFHDSRATAITHLSRRVDPLTLARMSGHRDLRILLQRYYRESAQQIAARLAKPSGRLPPPATGGTVE